MKRFAVLMAVWGAFLLMLPAEAVPTTETRECSLVHLDTYTGMYTDPIVWPGQDGYASPAGPHRHYFFGQAETAKLEPEPNTCLPVTNRNVYWVPALQRVASPSFPIGAVGMTVTITRGPKAVIPPDGLMQVSHEAEFLCDGVVVGLTPVGCSDGFAHMRVLFQSCWDGVNLRGYSFGAVYQQPHLAFPVAGQCPPGFSKIGKLRVTAHYDLRPSFSQAEALTVRTGPGNLLGGDPLGGHADVIWGT